MARTDGDDVNPRAPESRRELRADFREVDADADGHITFAEFARLMDNLEAGMSVEELKIGFSEIDTNHDGRIDLPEFVDWWTDR
jgi:Ca2+-binding EF-hand superfamily protein